MRPGDAQAIREILHQALVRYLTVRPGGFELDAGDRLRPVIEARIVSFGGARTLYESGRPSCRSLDAVRSITHADRCCADCRLRQRCTPQLRLDLVVDHRPFRLLLAHTSAKRFLFYEAQLRQRALVLEDLVHRIEVVNRGSWGELRFTRRD